MTDWRATLDGLFAGKTAPQAGASASDAGKAKAWHFVETVVIPAFDELVPELVKHGREVKLSADPESASITVSWEGTEELHYTIRVHVGSNRTYPKVEVRAADKRTGRSLRTVEATLRTGPQNYDIEDCTQADVIAHFL